jgi:hypothetical protein
VSCPIMPYILTFLRYMRRPTTGRRGKLKIPPNVGTNLPSTLWHVPYMMTCTLESKIYFQLSATHRCVKYEGKSENKVPYFIATK